jgi:hypothetical protein
MPAGVNPSISYINKRAQIGRDAGIGWKLSSPTYLRYEVTFNLDDYGKKGSITLGAALRSPASVLSKLAMASPEFPAFA